MGQARIWQAPWIAVTQTKISVRHNREERANLKFAIRALSFFNFCLIKLFQFLSDILNHIEIQYSWTGSLSEVGRILFDMQRMCTTGT